MSDANNNQFDPEWLEDFADRLGSNDQALDAVPFRQIAKAWNDDKRELADAQLQNSILQRRIDQIVQFGNAPLSVTS
jgi:hypothetical protein